MMRTWQADGGIITRINTGTEVRRESGGAQTGKGSSPKATRPPSQSRNHTTAATVTPSNAPSLAASSRRLPPSQS
jgi:hypothetical protein